MKYIPSGDQIRQLDQLLNQGLLLSDNMDGALLEIITTGVEQDIIHGLGRVPIGFIVLQIIQLEDFDPILISGNMQVNKNDEGWLLFTATEGTISRDTIGVDLWSRRTVQWTKERLFLQSNVANLKVRLFVM